MNPRPPPTTTIATVLLVAVATLPLQKVFDGWTWTISIIGAALAAAVIATTVETVRPRTSPSVVVAFTAISAAAWALMVSLRDTFWSAPGSGDTWQDLGDGIFNGWGALLLGLLLGVTLGPCTFAFFAPVFAVAFGVASRDVALPSALVGAFAAGHTLAIAGAGLLGLKLSGWLRRGGPATARARGAAGWALLAAAVYAYAFLFPESGEAPGAYDIRVALALNLYSRGLSRGFQTGDDETVELRAGSFELPFGTLEVELEPSGFTWAGYRLARFGDLYRFEVRGLRNRYRRPGIGAALGGSLDPPDHAADASPALRVPGLITTHTGLTILAQLLRRRGLQVRIYDEQITPFQLRMLEGADLLGISIQTSWAEAGYAILQPCPITHWSIQWQITPASFLSAEGRYIVRVRVKPGPLKQQAGPLVHVGLYSFDHGSVFQRNATVADLPGTGYQWFEAATIDAPRDGMTLYIGPTTDSVAEHVYIDRVELIPEAEWKAIKAQP